MKKDDMSEAVKWYRKAAEQGFSKAQYALALRYENGEGVLDENTNRATVIYEIYKILKQKIEELNFEKLFYEIEMPLARVLFEMEREGFKIDREGLSNYGIRLDETVNELAERIYGYAGTRGPFQGQGSSRGRSGRA